MAVHNPVGSGVSLAIGTGSTYVTFKQESAAVRIHAKGSDLSLIHI